MLVLVLPLWYGVHLTVPHLHRPHLHRPHPTLHLRPHRHHRSIGVSFDSRIRPRVRPCPLHMNLFACVPCLQGRNKFQL